jgi:uncharacterized protein involved in exopolysaccharide biosynthesis
MRVRASVWLQLICTTAIVTALYTAHAFKQPLLYRAEVTVLVPARYSPTRLLAKELGMPSELEIGSARIEAVFRSQSLLNNIVEHFDLMKRYGFANRDRARETVGDMCRVTQEVDRHLVFLSCDTDDPRLSKAMVDEIASQGSKIYRRISQSVAAQEREFLDHQLDVARTARDAATERLRVFEAQHRVADIDAQSLMVVRAIARLEGQKIAKQVELAYRRVFASATEGSTQQIQHQVDVIDAQLRDLQGEKAAAGSSDSVLIPASRIPQLQFEIHVLVRNAAVAEAVFDNLLRRYDLAKVAEARDTPSYDILEPASLPTRSDRPHRVVMIVSGIVSGIMLGFGWVLLPGWWRRQRWYSSGKRR